MTENYFEQLGSESGVRRIVDAFIDRVFEDQMIGFYFRRADRGRLKELEYQLAARFLGADVEYQGRPLDQVHAKHPIMGGQFARRMQILRETLELFGVAEPIRDAWLRHTEELRPLVTRDSGSDCDPIAARDRAKQAP